MAPMLTDMPADRLDALIKHPFHRGKDERLVGFVKELREWYSAEDFVTFQRQLLQAALAVNLSTPSRLWLPGRLRRGGGRLRRRRPGARRAVRAGRGRCRRRP